MSSFGVKKCLNFQFWPKNQIQFLFFQIILFFLEITCFWAKKSFEFSILAENSDSILVKTFFFGDHLFLGWKIVWISDSGRKLGLNFGEDLFFLEITCFWAEKLFEFPILAENSDSVSVRTFFFGDHLFLSGKNFWTSELSEKFRLNFRTNRVKLIQEQWKFGSRSFALFSLFQKSPLPPPFSKPWLRACSYGKSVLNYYYITFM